MGIPELYDLAREAFAERHGFYAVLSALLAVAIVLAFHWLQKNVRAIVPKVIRALDDDAQTRAEDPSFPAVPPVLVLVILGAAHIADRFGAPETDTAAARAVRHEPERFQGRVLETLKGLVEGVIAGPGEPTEQGKRQRLPWHHPATAHAALILLGVSLGAVFIIDMAAGGRWGSVANWLLTAHGTLLMTARMARARVRHRQKQREILTAVRGVVVLAGGLAGLYLARYADHGIPAGRRWEAGCMLVTIFGGLGISAFAWTGALLNLPGARKWFLRSLLVGSVISLWSFGVAACIRLVAAPAWINRGTAAVAALTLFSMGGLMVRAAHEHLVSERV